MQYTELLKYNREELFEKYPAFSLYPAFRLECGIPFSNAIAIIVQVYTPKSEDLSELWSMKLKAAKNCGYKVDDGKITDDACQKCLEGKDEIFNKMIVAYCRMTKNLKFSRIVTYVDALYMKMEALRNGDDDGEKTKDTITVIDTLDQKIEKGIREFLNGDVNQTVDVLVEVERVSLGIRPEDIAEKILNGEDPVDIRPYGKNYNFEKFGNREKINPYDEE